MKKRELLIGTVAAAVVGIALIFGMFPLIVAAGSTTTAHLSLQYRSVSNTGDCLDFGLGAPCTECTWEGTQGGTMTNTVTGATIDSVCTDVLTAVGAKQTWHAYYYSVNGFASVNLGETSGTLLAGQSMTFIFGLSGNCPAQYVSTIVKIVGNYNTVQIGYSGCG